MPKSIFRPVNSEGGDGSGRLKKVLEECIKSSDNGFNAAKSSAGLLLSLVGEARSSFEKAMNPEGELAKAGEECRKAISEQFIAISEDLSKFSRLINEDIETKRNSKKAFSVIVFGRTEAGKSTLMEVLTHGDGKSIGKGCQRTTRDIREYMWEGLNVIDVPGIGASDGEKDTALAFDEAKKADMVLFLMADSPQAEEVDRFIDLRKMGKPLICVHNIKRSIESLANIENGQGVQEDTAEMLNYEIRELGNKFRSKNEQDYQNSFAALVKEKSAGIDIEFIPVHLLLAFKAQKPGFAAYSGMFTEASRINVLINRIIDEVVKKGTFISFKTFMDLVSAPMTKGAGTLLNSSCAIEPQAKAFAKERIAAQDWMFHFNARQRQKLKDLRDAFFNEIDSHIPHFASMHYANRNAMYLWTIEIEKSDAFRKYEQALKDIDKECTEHFEKLMQNMENEFSFFIRHWHEREFNPGPLGDPLRAWNRGFVIANLIGDALIAFGKNIYTTIGGFVLKGASWIGRQLLRFMPSGAERAYNARIDLQNMLEESLRNQADSMETQANEYFEKSIVRDKIEKGINALFAMETSIHNLAAGSRQLGLNIVNEKEKLNRSLVNKALDNISCAQYSSIIKKVARVPGKITLLAVSDKNDFAYYGIAGQLEKLLNEQIKIAEYRSTELPDRKDPKYRDIEFNIKKLIAEIIGQDCMARDVYLNRNDNIIELNINLDTYSYEIQQEIKTSIVLAEQITGMHIVRKGYAETIKENL